MSVPKELRYTREHEWTRIEGKLVTVGITSFAVEQLGDITMVELPREGEKIRRQDVFGTVESVKAVSDLFAPVTGTIKKVNTPLADTPEYVQDEPYDEGWMVQIEVDDEKELAELMDADAYEKFLEQEAA